MGGEIIWIMLKCSICTQDDASWIFGFDILVSKVHLVKLGWLGSENPCNWYLPVLKSCREKAQKLQNWRRGRNLENAYLKISLTVRDFSMDHGPSKDLFQSEHHFGQRVQDGNSECVRSTRDDLRWWGDCPYIGSRLSIYLDGMVEFTQKTIDACMHSRVPS